MDEFTDAELAQLAHDPRMTDPKVREAQIAKLTPGELERYRAIAMRPKQEPGKVEGFVNGVMNNVGDTINSLGEMVHNTPVLGKVTDAIAKAVGPEGTDPNTAFAGVKPMMYNATPAEKAGGVAERIGEFMLPGGPAGEAAAAGLTKLIPDAAGPGARIMLHRAATVGGRMAGEAGSAYALGKLHGDPDPTTQAEVAAAGPLLGFTARRVIPGLTQNPMAKALLPVAAGAGAWHLTGDVTKGLAGGMIAGSLARGAARRFLDDPQKIYEALKTAEQASTIGGRVGAGVVNEVRAHRRMLGAQQ